MHPYQQTVQTVQTKLNTTLERIEGLFNLPDAAYLYRPSPENWTIQEILEHITLTSKYLLIIIQNSTQTCLERAVKQTPEPGESDFGPLEVIGHPDNFPWLRPEHMEPTGQVPLTDIRATIREQYALCQTLLGQLTHGKGTLHKVQMSVQDLGKLDVYQFMFFLTLHAQRHCVEIERLLEEWRKHGH